MSKILEKGDRIAPDNRFLGLYTHDKKVVAVIAEPKYRATNPPSLDVRCHLLDKENIQKQREKMDQEKIVGILDAYGSPGWAEQHDRNRQVLEEAAYKLERTVFSNEYFPEWKDDLVFKTKLLREYYPEYDPTAGMRWQKLSSNDIAEEMVQAPEEYWDQKINKINRELGENGLL